MNLDDILLAERDSDKKNPWNICEDPDYIMDPIWWKFFSVYAGIIEGVSGNYTLYKWYIYNRNRSIVFCSHWRVIWWARCALRYRHYSYRKCCLWFQDVFSVLLKGLGWSYKSHECPHTIFTLFSGFLSYRYCFILLLIMRLTSTSIMLYSNTLNG